MAFKDDVSVRLKTATYVARCIPFVVLLVYYVALVSGKDPKWGSVLCVAVAISTLMDMVAHRISMEVLKCPSCKYDLTFMFKPWARKSLNSNYSFCPSCAFALGVKTNQEIPVASVGLQVDGKPFRLLIDNEWAGPIRKLVLTFAIAGICLVVVGVGSRTAWFLVILGICIVIALLRYQIGEIRDPKCPQCSQLLSLFFRVIRHPAIPVDMKYCPCCAQSLDVILNTKKKV